MELPVRKKVERSSPLTLSDWEEHMNPEISDGQVTNLPLLKEKIFRGVCIYFDGHRNRSFILCFFFIFL